MLYVSPFLVGSRSIESQEDLDRVVINPKDVKELEKKGVIKSNKKMAVKANKAEG